MTIAQAREILQKWKECIDEKESSEMFDSSDKNTHEVQFVPSNGIRIKDIIEEELAVEYGPHPPTLVILVDSEEGRENEDEIDLSPRPLDH